MIRVKVVNTAGMDTSISRDTLVITPSRRVSMEICLEYFVSCQCFPSVPKHRWVLVDFYATLLLQVTFKEVQRIPIFYFLYHPVFSTLYSRSKPHF